MSVWVTLYAAVLFFVLSPNVLLRLPRKGGKFLVAGVHALAFALIFHFTHNLVWRMTSNLEGVRNRFHPPPPPPPPSCDFNSIKKKVSKNSSFLNSASTCSMLGNTLTAMVKKRDGKYNISAIDVSRCNKDETNYPRIKNDNGNLKCDNTTA